MFDLQRFISDKVICRPFSMFLKDLEKRREELTAKIAGKRVLVIGGAGSIGSSFIRALVPYKPKSLVVVDTNENALAELTRSLRSGGYFVPDDYIPYPMDYASPIFAKMFKDRGGFDIVANFAAHKHVRSEKDMYSVTAMFRNNVLHARSLLDLLDTMPPDCYFCVSTDKAANPVNLMGASKRLMEDLIFAHADRYPVRTARFANVAFSNGSLPDGFLHRLAALEPLTAPTDVKRYFVSPEESGQICLLAAMTADNGEILYPKLSEAQMTGFDRIAEDLLTAYGYRVLKCASDAEAVERAAALKEGSLDYPVHFFTSDTSGEKPFEEFYTESETRDESRYEALGVITGKVPADRAAVLAFLEKLSGLLDQEQVSKELLVEQIGTWLPNFAHIETGKSLDTKM